MKLYLEDESKVDIEQLLRQGGWAGVRRPSFSTKAMVSKRSFIMARMARSSPIMKALASWAALRASAVAVSTAAARGASAGLGGGGRRRLLPSSEPAWAAAAGRAARAGADARLIAAAAAFSTRRPASRRPCHRPSPPGGGAVHQVGAGSTAAVCSGTGAALGAAALAQLFFGAGGAPAGFGTRLHSGLATLEHALAHIVLEGQGAHGQLLDIVLRSWPGWPWPSGPVPGRRPPCGRRWAG